MADVVLGGMLLAITLITALFASRVYNQRVLAKAKEDLWKVARHSDGETLLVSCEKRGEVPFVIGRVRRDDQDRFVKLKEIEEEARCVCDDWNGPSDIYS